LVEHDIDAVEEAQIDGATERERIPDRDR
jgi:hypothetical protein